MFCHYVTIFLYLPLHIKALLYSFAYTISSTRSMFVIIFQQKCLQTQTILFSPFTCHSRYLIYIINPLSQSCLTSSWLGAAHHRGWNQHGHTSLATSSHVGELHPPPHPVMLYAMCGQAASSHLLSSGLPQHCRLHCVMLLCPAPSGRVGAGVKGAREERGSLENLAVAASGVMRGQGEPHGCRLNPKRMPVGQPCFKLQGQDWHLRPTGDIWWDTMCTANFPGMSKYQMFLQKTLLRVKEQLKQNDSIKQQSLPLTINSPFFSNLS